MQGQHVRKAVHLLQPGEYTQATAGAHWYACTPNGLLANLRAHTVTLHDDDTISATPSILVNSGEPVSYHGYLERGTWRAC